LLVILPLLKLLPVKKAFAHCDIPCGIYDPHEAQLASHTVIRMTKMITEAGDDLAKVHRMMNVKEEHSEKVKNEVRIIWGDYFKEEHLKDYPDLHKLVFNIMKLASKTKQETNIEVAQSLLTEVQKFAEIFYKTKGLEPVRVKSPYPTEGELVIYK
jgi:nickel superoxide dismutase